MWFSIVYLHIKVKKGIGPLAGCCTVQALLLAEKVLRTQKLWEKGKGEGARGTGYVSLLEKALSNTLMELVG